LLPGLWPPELAAASKAPRGTLVYDRTDRIGANIGVEIKHFST
jgi:hypothetical protein